MLLGRSIADLLSAILPDISNVQTLKLNLLGMVCVYLRVCDLYALRNLLSVCLQVRE